VRDLTRFAEVTKKLFDGKPNGRVAHSRAEPDSVKHRPDASLKDRSELGTHRFEQRNVLRHEMASTFIAVALVEIHRYGERLNAKSLLVRNHPKPLDLLSCFHPVHWIIVVDRHEDERTRAVREHPCLHSEGAIESQAA